MLKYKFDVKPKSVDVLHGDMLKPFTVFLINGGRIVLNAAIVLSIACMVAPRVNQ